MGVNIIQFYFCSRKMPLAAAARLTLQNCFTIMWNRLRIAFVCAQPAAEEQHQGQHENEQEDGDGVGMHDVRVENVFSCCGGRTVNVAGSQPYTTQGITDASETRQREERSGLYE